MSRVMLVVYWSRTLNTRAQPICAAFSAVSTSSLQIVPPSAPTKTQPSAFESVVGLKPRRSVASMLVDHR
jgi:hypothetical protein